MAVNFRAIGNFFTVAESSTNEKYISESVDSIRYFRDASDVFSFYPKLPNGNETTILNTTVIGVGRNTFAFADILDFRTGAAFGNADRLEEYLATILGKQNDTNSLTNINYGLFAQTADGTILNTQDVEQNIIGAGVGSLLIPANTLEIGSSYNLKMGGLMRTNGGGSRSKYRIKVKSGTTILAISDDPIDGEWVQDEPWDLDIDFTIRTIGATGTIYTNATLQSPRLDARNLVGTGFQNNQAINTTLSHTISVTFEFTVKNSNDYFQSYNCVFTKQY